MIGRGRGVSVRNHKLETDSRRVFIPWIRCSGELLRRRHMKGPSQSRRQWSDGRHSVKGNGALLVIECDEAQRDTCKELAFDAMNSHTEQVGLQKTRTSCTCRLPSEAVSTRTHSCDVPEQSPCLGVKALAGPAFEPPSDTQNSDRA